MNVIIVFFLFAKLVQYLFKVSSENTYRSPHKIIFISNSKEVGVSMLLHYYSILELDPKISYCIEDVEDAYIRHLDYYFEDRTLGYKVKYNIDEMTSARNYIKDSFLYRCSYN